jgi:hypothetical protein
MPFEHKLILQAAVVRAQEVYFRLCCVALLSAAGRLKHKSPQRPQAVEQRPVLLVQADRLLLLHGLTMSWGRLLQLA